METKLSDLVEGKARRVTLPKGFLPQKLRKGADDDKGSQNKPIGMFIRLSLKLP